MNNNTLSIPTAIIIAGAIIAGAVIYTNIEPRDNSPKFKIAAAPISDSDHILGDRNASIKIVEYSDTECPFCQRHHTTLHDIVGGENPIEDVAWVYRHFPIENLHPTAIREAEATECVAKIVGEESFWVYLDSIYENTPQDGPLADELLFTLAEAVGVSNEDLSQCLDTGEMSEKIQTAIVEAGDAGARGTPYNVLFLDKKLSADQIAAIEGFDQEITPTQDIFQVDEKNRNKVAMSGAIPREIIEDLISIIRN